MQALSGLCDNVNSKSYGTRPTGVTVTDGLCLAPCRDVGQPVKSVSPGAAAASEGGPLVSPKVPVSCLENVHSRKGQICRTSVEDKTRAG